MSQDGPPPPPVAPPPPGEPGFAGAPAPALPPIPWEDRERLGLATALLENLRLFVTAPQEAFARTAGGGDLVSPVLWTAIVALVMAVVQWMWSLVFSVPLMGLLEGADARLAPVLGALGGGGALSVLFGPVLAVAMLFVGAAVFHLTLMLVGALDRSRAGYEGTLRALGYAYTAQVAQVVPLVGGLIAAVWMLVLVVIGFERLHDTSQGRAIAAALIPLAICCGCGLLLAIGFGAAIAGLAGSQLH